jgi:hypothetical protein
MAPPEARIERMAAVQGWLTAEPKKRLILDRLYLYFDRRTAEGKNAKPRQILIAAKTLIGADLRQQEVNLQREIALGGGPAGTLADVVGLAEERANAVYSERERERDRGESTGAIH